MAEVAGLVIAAAGAAGSGWLASGAARGLALMGSVGAGLAGVRRAVVCLIGVVEVLGGRGSGLGATLGGLIVAGMSCINKGRGGVGTVMAWLLSSSASKPKWSATIRIKATGERRADANSVTAWPGDEVRGSHAMIWRAALAGATALRQSGHPDAWWELVGRVEE